MTSTRSQRELNSDFFFFSFLIFFPLVSASGPFSTSFSQHLGNFRQRFFLPKNGHKCRFMNCTPLLFGRKTPFPALKRQNSAKVYKIRNQNQAISRQIHAFPNTFASRFSRQTLFSLKNGAPKQAGRAKRPFSAL